MKAVHSQRRGGVGAGNGQVSERPMRRVRPTGWGVGSWGFSMQLSQARLIGRLRKLSYYPAATRIGWIPAVEMADDEFDRRRWPIPGSSGIISGEQQNGEHWDMHEWGFFSWAASAYSVSSIF